MRETGSEFWNNEGLIRSPDGRAVYLMSGMTALDHIISDILAERPLKKVLLPSYCCESMIVPFLRRGVEVGFFPFEGTFSYPEENDADAVLLLEYFGYRMPDAGRLAELIRTSGKVLIFDGTHSIDGAPEIEKYADYSFISYRKWAFCNCAKLVKHNGDFNIAAPTQPDRKYIGFRIKAAGLKSAYMAGAPVEKKSFLNLYAQAEDELFENYRGFAAIPEEVAPENVRDRRRENARLLIDGLKEISGIELFRPDLGPEDIPLFVPVLLEKERRDTLRRYLISEAVYCPVHWPYSDVHGMKSRLYDRELSLICDQRYDTDDIGRELELIKDFFRQKG